MRLTDKQLERIVKKANSKAVIKECEPQVAFALEIQKWMVRRVLTAYEKVTGREV